MLKTFNSHEESYEEFALLCRKERVKIGHKINELIENYVKGDRNPEEFEDPDYITCPAFYRNSESWNAYLSQALPEELQHAKDQIILIDHILGRHL